MIKEKEISFIQNEMLAHIATLEKRDTFNTQVIEELDKSLNIAKYGSVAHVTKVTRLSTMRNYKLRIAEIIEVFKGLKDLQSVESLKTNLTTIITDSKANLKNSTDAMNAVEVFTNDYIKNEILVKTYKELSDLYAEADEMLNKVKEALTAENAKLDHPVESKKEKEQTKKEAA